MSAVTQEILWLKGVQEELFPEEKHIDVRHHFTRENVEQKIIKFEHVSTDKTI